MINVICALAIGCAVILGFILLILIVYYDDLRSHNESLNYMNGKLTEELLVERKKHKIDLPKHEFQTTKKNVLRHTAHIEVPFEMLNQNLDDRSVPDVVKRELALRLVETMQDNLEYCIEPCFEKIAWDCYARVDTLEKGV